MFIPMAVAIADARAGKRGERVYSGRVLQLLERGYIAFKSSTYMIVISGFLEPVLYLLSFGYGIGKLLPTIAVGGETIKYAAFIAPALLATSAMNGAIYDSTMNVFFKLNHDRIYHGMLATSMGPLDVALGEIGWALIRGFSYACAFMVVIAPLGLVVSAWGLLAIPAAVLIAFGFASCGMAVTSYMKSFQQLEIVNMILLPMFLFSGSFYPITVFPQWLQFVVNLLPLSHAIDLVRGLCLGHINFGLAGHALYFVVMIVVGLFFTTKRLNALFMK
ncbi:MAG: ABC transporter [Actinobacteria bacterium]|nr:ABC transporter [Actinomycetota bacterium]MTB04980.1 ABC transporter [Actinomycetota bacterium]